MACSSGDWLNLNKRTTPTPTFILAEYTTPTFTPQPTQTATIIPVQFSATAPTGSPTSPAATTITNSGPTKTSEPAPSHTPGPTATTTPAPVTAQPPAATAAPSPSAPAGRIVFPVDDGGGYYDLWAVELPAGEPFLVMPRAHQPNFYKDGRLLVKTQGSDLGESIGLIDATFSWQGIINESPEDSYPFWHPDGTRYTYSNSNLVLDPDTAHLAPYIFTTCSLQLPKFENDTKCRDYRQWGEITVGEAPVWTEDDRIAFFSYKGDDGIYFVESASVLREAGGLGPKQLLVSGNGLPTDTVGEQLFFSAGDIDGNWEAYAINLDGANLINLSNSPHSQDGLPTVSPDGNWIAFVSDRDGRWAIWAVPRTGGEAIKITDIPTLSTSSTPWGTERRAWMTERISWGP